MAHNPHPDLAGKLVVVTGAAGGQGAAEALLLADCGAHVVATDLATDAVGVLAAAAGRPGQVEYRRLNVSAEDDWADLAEYLHSRGLPVHGLVNNAGVTHRARLGQTLRADWDRVIGINLTGPMLGIQAIAPLMTAGSSIVNVGSAAALGGHYTAAYTCSKWGLRGLTHVAATQYGPAGIRVNIVHPGFIATEMTASAPDAMVSAHLELTPLERVGRATEVAAVVTFLLSEAAAYVSGAEIPVDGAYTSSAGAKYMADRIAATPPR